LLFALLVACAAAIPKGYIRVPGGKLAHRDCIHKAPNGARISRLESGAGYRIEPSNDSSDETAVMFEAYEITKCKHRLLRAGQGVAEPGQPEPQHGAAWIVDAMQDNSAGNGFTLFAANFTIPPPPSNVDVLLYYWPGTEDEVMGDVIQPVLQFGSNGEEGGPYWSYMAWYVSGDGDVITGPFITPISAALRSAAGCSCQPTDSRTSRMAMCPAAVPPDPPLLSRWPPPSQRSKLVPISRSRFTRLTAIAPNCHPTISWCSPIW